MDSLRKVFGSKLDLVKALKDPLNGSALHCSVFIYLR